jgi:hypothetical protein
VGVELTLLSKDPVFIGVAAPMPRPTATEWYCVTTAETPKADVCIRACY